jgi:hypothetical protein
MIAFYHNEFDDIFSGEINKKDKLSGNTMKEGWIDNQFTNAIDGIDTIDCGVTNGSGCS